MIKRKLLELADQLISKSDIRLRLDNFMQSSVHREFAAIRADIRRDMPDNPAVDGFKVYCQNDEDGIIQSILSRIPAGRLSRTFIEIGCGNGIENNTHALVLQGYRGYWVDGSAENIGYIRERVPALSGPSCRLKVQQHFVDVENIKGILAEAAAHLQTREPDLYSLDIDGNDLVVLKKSLEVLNPAVVCVEYNAKFPPPIRISIAYAQAFRWTGDDYLGASLQMLCDALPGHRLVSCNLSGVNAFFVRNDLAEGFGRYSPLQLYQPKRTHLCILKSGHPATLKWLEQVLRD